MSRSQPSAPLYLHGAIKRVERLLAEHYPEELTARQIAGLLVADGFRWPLREGWVRGPGGRAVFRRDEYGDPTPDRVRRVCDMKGNRTVIAHGSRVRPHTYTIYGWAIDKLREENDGTS